jgi:Histidine kinase
MRKGTLVTVVVVTAWWLLSGLIWSGQIVTMYAARASGGPTLRQVLGAEMASATLWIPLTLMLLWWVRRTPIERGRVARALASLGAAVAAVIVLRAVAVWLFNDAVGWYRQLPAWPILLWTSVLNNLLTAWMIVGVAHALIYAERESRRRRQAVELEARLAQARLDALSAQLNPHFLFNALNSIAELVHGDPAAADRMLVGLGELLRQSLAGAQSQQVALGEELELLAHYIDIEKLRLGTRLRFECSVAPELLPAQVPRLLLQPLVENAIRHAVATRCTPGRVTVRARQHDDRLLLEVQDDGGEAPAAPGHGLGLANTRARLQCLYGDDHRLELSPQPGGGTLVGLDVPLRGLGQPA